MQSFVSRATEPHYIGVTPNMSTKIKRHFVICDIHYRQTFHYILMSVTGILHLLPYTEIHKCSMSKPSYSTLSEQLHHVIEVQINLYNIPHEQLLWCKKQMTMQGFHMMQGHYHTSNTPE